MKSVLDTAVSCFANYNTPNNPKSVNLLSWLTSDKHAATVGKIRQIEDKKERDALKATLPAITPSGTFTYRLADKLVRHSGFLQFDIDLGDNRNVGNYGELKTLICQSPNVAYCGLSVSGTGIWGLIPVAYVERHSEHFDYIKKVFAKSHIIIDDKPRSVASLRGYSYDPSGYFNHNAVPLERYAQIETVTRQTPRTPIGDHQPTGDYDADCFAWCVEVKDEAGFVQGNRNGWLTKLVAMLNDFGVSRSHVESECTARYAQPGFTEREIIATIRSIYLNKAGRHGCERFEPKTREAKTVPFPAPRPATRQMPPGSIEAFESEKNAQNEPKPEKQSTAVAQNDAPEPSASRDDWQPLGVANLEFRPLQQSYPAPKQWADAADFCRTTFRADAPWADTEIEELAREAGYSFADVVPFFDYLGRAPANEQPESGKMYWYALRAAEPKEINLTSSNLNVA